jgi:CRP/FNR family cyclic AMP-dependent transcriptional regulator
MEDLKNILAEHPFFKGLNEEYFALIVGCASNMRVDAGKMIHREGEEANHFYLIRSGKVTLQIMTPNKGPVIIETLEEGDILGWSWLVPPYTWHFDARALALTRMMPSMENVYATSARTIITLGTNCSNASLIL